MVNRLWIVVALLLLNWVELIAQSALPTSLTADRFHLYVLAGQSNMAGRGTVEAVDKISHPRIWMLNKDGQWVPATDPMHFDKPDMVGVGPGLAFGKAMAEQDTAAFIGLIPAAVGGSPIDSWQPAGYHEQTNSHPYDDALKRVTAAQKTGTLHGILWHQGESDSKPELVSSYQAKLTQLIGRFRQAFNAPNLPVVVGTLGDFYGRKTPVATQINAVLRDLPKHVSGMACVEATGLTDKGDQTHFDAPSARALGKRYAEAMQVLELTK